MSAPREVSHIDPLPGTDFVRILFKDGGEEVCHVASGSLLYEIAVWALSKLEPHLRIAAIAKAGGVP